MCCGNVLPMVVVYDIFEKLQELTIVTSIHSIF